jgi:seryl-tRNA synthetase
MIDARILREQPAEVKTMLERRRMEGAVDLSRLADLDAKMRVLTQETDGGRETRNRLSKEIGNLKRTGGDASALMDEVNRNNERITAIETEMASLNDEYNELLLSVPNMLHESVPTGKDEHDNVVVRTWGTKPAFDFTPRPHFEIGTDLGILDFERGVKLAGTRFYVYRKMAAALERALLSYMLDTHTTKNGYTETFAPFVVNDESMIGTGQYPKFKDEYYRIERDGLSLIPTAEVPLTNLYRDEIIDGAELPIYVTGQSSCFRREAGSAGRDTRGLVRVHQFQKVELVKFVEPESSFDELEKLVADAESVLQGLGLHYRVVLLCSADTSASSSKTYDIEVWMPGLDRYMEISSCSNFRDYQARRARIRYKTAGSAAKPALVHTLNGSGVAAGRAMGAVMENYQQKDGTFLIPDVLKPYMKGYTV